MRTMARSTTGARRPRPYAALPIRVGRRGLATGVVLLLTAGWLQPAAAEPASATPEVRELSVPAAKPDRSTPRSPDGLQPVGSVLAQLPATRTKPFSTLGVTWAAGTAATPQVEVRIRAGAAWSGWQLLETSDDADGAEAVNARPGTDPLWVGDSNGVEVRLRATPGTAGRAAPADVKVALIDPGSLASDTAPRASRIAAPVGTTTGTTGSTGSTGTAAGVPYLYPAPAVVTRGRLGGRREAAVV